MKNRLVEQLVKMRGLTSKLERINEASIGADGSLNLSFNPLDSVEMLADALQGLNDTDRQAVGRIIQLSGLMKSKYSYMFSEDQKMGMVTFSGKLSEKTEKIAEDVIKSLYYTKGGKKNHQLANEQILDLINHDIQLILNEHKLRDELTDFEELLVGAFGDAILLTHLDTDTYEKVMNPYTTLDDFKKEKEDEPVIDQDGNLTGGHNRVPLEEPVVNYAQFERFVQQNPQYKPHYDKWAALSDAHTDAMLAAKKADAIYSLEQYQAAYKEVKASGVSATISHRGLYDDYLHDHTAKWVAEAYFAAKRSGTNPEFVQTIENLF